MKAVSGVTITKYGTESIQATLTIQYPQHHIIGRVSLLLTEEKVNGKAVSVNRPWRPTGMRDVEALTFSRKSARRWG
jgi:hypothetical protein